MEHEIVFLSFYLPRVLSAGSTDFDGVTYAVGVSLCASVPQNVSIYFF